MMMLLDQPLRSFDFSNFEQVVIAGDTARRLLLAALLGAIIGLEREYHRKAAGVRTNLLLCLGCAFFTLLSYTLAGEANPDKGRVASNIVQGIGFLGGGLILHNRNRVSGLTSAAGVFVVAAIGMACGAGLFAAAVLATIVVISSVVLVGILERRLNLKMFPRIYEARGTDDALMLVSVVNAMDALKQRLNILDRDNLGSAQRISFHVMATLDQHNKLQERLQQEPAITNIYAFIDPEED
jgi:putative Mg2+ transporter-C (MgtC) family protein